MLVYKDFIYPQVIKPGWLENGPYNSDVYIKTSIYRGFSIAMFDYQRVDGWETLGSSKRLPIHVGNSKK